MLLLLQVGCSKLALKRDRFYCIISRLKRAAKNASTNGGDASRVGIIKRKDTSYTK